MKPLHQKFVFVPLGIFAIISISLLSFTSSDNGTEALLPDLLVTVPDSLFGSFCANKNNRVHVRIKNIGQFRAKGSVEVKLRLDPGNINQKKKMKLNLAPGQFTQAVFEKIKFRPGDNRITGIANQNKLIIETNYSNNGQTQSVHVSSCP